MWSKYNKNCIECADNDIDKTKIEITNQMRKYYQYIIDSTVDFQLKIESYTGNKYSTIFGWKLSLVFSSTKFCRFILSVNKNYFLTHIKI